MKDQLHVEVKQSEDVNAVLITFTPLAAEADEPDFDEDRRY